MILEDEIYKYEQLIHSMQKSFDRCYTNKDRKLAEYIIKKNYLKKYKLHLKELKKKKKNDFSCMIK